MTTKTSTTAFQNLLRYKLDILPGVTLGRLPIGIKFVFSANTDHFILRKKNNEEFEFLADQYFERNKELKFFKNQVFCTWKTDQTISAPVKNLSLFPLKDSPLVEYQNCSLADTTRVFYHLPFNILERSVQRIEKILKTCEQNELNIIHQTPQLKVEILDMLRFGFNSVQGIFNAYKLAAIKGHTTPDALRSTKAIHNAATDIFSALKLQILSKLISNESEESKDLDQLINEVVDNKLDQIADDEKIDCFLTQDIDKLKADLKSIIISKLS